MALQLLLLLLLTVSSECLTVGKKFVAVFPENIAFYHPSLPQNLLRVTALHDNTHVHVTNDLGLSLEGRDLQSGDSRTFKIDASLELSRTNLTHKVVSVQGDKPIAVEILSQKNKSIQTALLLPLEQLGKEYLVPPIPQILRTTMPQSNVTNEVTERSFFKLILVNGDEDNSITGPGGTDGGGGPISLKPRQVEQVWVEHSMVGTLVSGTARFLALFAHTCAVVLDCTCALLYTPLGPQNPNTSTFIVPSGLGQGHTFLLKASGGLKEEKLSSSGVKFEAPGPVVLQGPGRLLNLIPEEEFGSCFAVHTVADADNWAVVMAPTDSKDHVRMNNDPLTVSWTQVTATNYSWTNVPLTNRPNKTVFWHRSSLMAVWFLGQDAGAEFGNPAARLSETPDYRGCVVVPETLEVLDEQLSWQKSIQTCREKKMELISLKDLELQDHVYHKIQDLSIRDLNQTKLWMGLRRSSYSGRWYWISEEPLVHVDWAPGSPGSEDEGPCGQISFKDPKGPNWTHQDCCSEARPVCYRHPKLLKLD
ncbi:uncharacterized protein [Eucyclogobius newberryi]|uniref:uncharacterized protein n=1 Tax=Eucyclogobius newberryi TaxID=166745 RepID=UPI003B59B9C1